MTAEEVLLEKFKILPINRQRELLDFAEFLESKESRNKEETIDLAIDEVFATRKTLLTRLAEGVK